MVYGWMKTLPCITLLLHSFICLNSTISTKVRGYFYRNEHYSGVYYRKTQFETEQVLLYDTSSFKRSYDAVDSRNIRQQDYEYRFAIDYGFTEDAYEHNLLSRTCVITATTIIVDYYIRKNNQFVDTYEIYSKLLFDSYNKGYFYEDEKSGGYGVDQEDVGYVLYDGLQLYKDKIGIDFNYIEKKTDNIYETVKNIVISEDVALYIFSPGVAAHAMVACGYVNLDVTMEDGYGKQVNAIVVNELQNNPNPSLSFSKRWYNETEVNDPGKDIANFAFIPENDAVSGHDYLWTLRSTLQEVNHEDF